MDGLYGYGTRTSNVFLADKKAAVDIDVKHTRRERDAEKEDSIVLVGESYQYPRSISDSSLREFRLLPILSVWL